MPLFRLLKLVFFGTIIIFTLNIWLSTKSYYVNEHDIGISVNAVLRDGKSAGYPDV